MGIVIETLLRDAGLLQGLDEAATSALLGRIAVQTYEPGAFLVTEGEIGDAAFVLLAGSLQVLATRPDGGWAPLSRLEPGALFGEQALLGRAGGRRAATVRAIGPVTVARLGTDEFHEALPDGTRSGGGSCASASSSFKDRLAQQASVFRALPLPGPDDDEAGAWAPSCAPSNEDRPYSMKGRPRRPSTSWSRVGRGFTSTGADRRSSSRGPRRGSASGSGGSCGASHMRPR